MTEEQKMQWLKSLIESGANVAQINLGDGTQNFYVGGNERPDKNDVVQDVEEVEENNIQDAPSELSPSRQRIIEKLLLYVDKGDWILPVNSGRIKDYLKTILGASDECMATEDWKASANLWKLLEQGRGDRIVVVMQNLIGYFVYCGWLPKGSPALNKTFFGNEDGYSNIDKGNPNGSGMSEGFKRVLPVLEKYKSLVCKNQK